MTKRRRTGQSVRKRHAALLLLIPGFLLFVYLFFCWLPWRHLAPGSAFDLAQAYFIRNSRESNSWQWVQFAFPVYVRAPYVAEEVTAREAQRYFNTSVSPASIQFTPPADGQPAISPELPETVKNEASPEQLAFYETFYQLDFESMEAYIAKHPVVLKNGYSGIKINMAGLYKNGTDIRTTAGDQVLAIDAENGILLIRISGEDYRGVLAIAKEPSRLHLFTSPGIRSEAEAAYDQGYGQTAGEIASAHDGLLAISGSGFIDEAGFGTGGALVGFCRSGGRDSGSHRSWGSKRLELREDNWLYVTEAASECGADVRDAMEFEPAMIVDGKRLESYVYTGNNPRACVGQTDQGEILMLAIEGRLADSAGCSVGECTGILQLYRAITAMNMDGGTSAMLWYEGEPVIRCSNPRTPEGRELPNAWVYGKQ